MQYRKLTAEFIGTFCVVFCGTGAIIINELSGGVITHAGIAIVFGLIVMCMIHAFGKISGAHFNPAVTFGFTVLQLFDKKQVVPYILSQIAGGISASLLLNLLFPLSKNLGATIPAGSDVQSLVLEFILMVILMLVILHVSHGAKEEGMLAGISIGAVVLLEAMFAGPVSGASMNPARSLAPAIVSGNVSQVYIYIVAPLSGALAAAGIWKLMQRQQ
jgi:aquaporin NIP